jgi:transcription antitermination factor NusG
MVHRISTADQPQTYALGDFWCVVRTEARSESEVAAALTDLGLEAFSPVEVRFGAVSRWHRLPRKVTSPLFPRFVFARGQEPLAMVDTLRFIRRAEGLLCCRSVPMRVRALDIERLQIKEKAGVYDKTTDQIARGPNGLALLSNVEIIDGPLSYYGGVVRALDGKKGTALVEVSGLGRSTSVEVPVDILRMVI